MLDTLFLYGGSATFLEQLQADYDRDPNSVRSWLAQLL